MSLKLYSGRHDDGCSKTLRSATWVKNTQTKAQPPPTQCAVDTLLHAALHYQNPVDTRSHLYKDKAVRHQQ